VGAKSPPPLIITTKFAVSIEPLWLTIIEERYGSSGNLEIEFFRSGPAYRFNRICSASLSPGIIRSCASTPLGILGHGTRRIEAVHGTMIVSSPTSEILISFGPPSWNIGRSWRTSAQSGSIFKIPRNPTTAVFSTGSVTMELCLDSNLLQPMMAYIAHVISFVCTGCRSHSRAGQGALVPRYKSAAYTFDS
jgi:hypothetical protein